MNLLVHENILQVFEMHTIYVGDPKKEKAKKKQKEESKAGGPKGDSSGSSLDLDSGSDKDNSGQDDADLDENDEFDDEMLGEGAQHADVIIIMEKADVPLSKILNSRIRKNQPFTQTELMNFWKKVISVFAYCTMFKITHNDIKPSNILLRKKSKEDQIEESKDD